MSCGTQKWAAKSRSVARPHTARWGLQVVTVDVRNKKVVFKDGFKLEYSKLLLAPGSRLGGYLSCPLWDTGRSTSQAKRASLILLCLSPKTLSCKGKEVESVLTIRTPEDANRVVRLARGRNAVIVGAGFLGERLRLLRVVGRPEYQSEGTQGLRGQSASPATHCLPPQGWRWLPT